MPVPLPLIELRAMEDVAKIFDGLGPKSVARICAFFADRAADEIELAEQDREGDDDE